MHCGVATVLMPSCRDVYYSLCLCSNCISGKSGSSSGGPKFNENAMPQAPDDDTIEKRAANQEETFNNNVSVTLDVCSIWEWPKMFPEVTNSDTL